MIFTKQFFIYISIGVISALVDIVMLKISMYYYSGIMESTLIGYISGLIVNYILHSIFTFKTSMAISKILKYLVVVFVNYWITVFIIFISVFYFSDVIYGKIISLPIIAFIGYITSKRWIYV
ncbi:GtrA family protein [Yersinia enterocolitica]|uniref:GtrA family protein n=1 Tax=unclassified Yersinia (in: enterobacteria) TaxID=2653513 RepID=UPI0009F201B5|nr:GtrA family protein [Yersinia enterocolitica]